VPAECVQRLLIAQADVAEPIVWSSGRLVDRDAVNTQADVVGQRVQIDLQCCKLLITDNVVSYR